MKDIINTTTYTAANTCNGEFSYTVCLAMGTFSGERMFWVSFVDVEGEQIAASYDYECASLKDAFNVAQQLAESEHNAWLDAQMVTICSIVAAWLN